MSDTGLLALGRVAAWRWSLRARREKQDQGVKRGGALPFGGKERRPREGLAVQELKELLKELKT